MRYAERILKEVDRLITCENISKSAQRMDETDCIEPFMANRKSLAQARILGIIASARKRYDGGAGSGNWGHAGRPGKLGGSTSGGGKQNRIGDKESGYTSFAKERKKLAKPHVSNKEELDKLPNGTVMKMIGKNTIKVGIVKKGDYFYYQDSGQKALSVATMGNYKGEVSLIIPKSAKEKYTQSAIPMERLKNTKELKDTEYDAIMRDKSGEIWRGCDSKTKQDLYGYTASEYSTINSQLRKDSCTSETKEKVNRIAGAIDKSTLPQDTWLYRGVDIKGASALLEVDASDLLNGDPKNLIGLKGKDKAFMSCGSAAGKGFTDKEVHIKIFAPKGTKGIYAEPFSKYGVGDGESWDGHSTQSYFSSEFETIL